MRLLRRFLPLLFFPSVLWAQAVDPFSYTVDLSTRHLSPGDETPIEITFHIPPSHYLYKEKMGLSFSSADLARDFEIAPLETSLARTKKDPFTGLDEEIFDRQVSYDVPQVIVSRVRHRRMN